MTHGEKINKRVVRGSRTPEPNTTLMNIAGHEDRIFVKFFPKDLDGFDAFWNGLKADMPDFEERLEYLDNLCEDCNAEKVQRKSWMICPECYSLNVN